MLRAGTLAVPLLFKFGFMLGLCWATLCRVGSILDHVEAIGLINQHIKNLSLNGVPNRMGVPKPSCSMEVSGMKTSTGFLLVALGRAS